MEQSQTDRKATVTDGSPSTSNPPQPGSGKKGKKQKSPKSGSSPGEGAMAIGVQATPAPKISTTPKKQDQPAQKKQDQPSPKNQEHQRTPKQQDQAQPNKQDQPTQTKLDQPSTEEAQQNGAKADGGKLSKAERKALALAQGLGQKKEQGPDGAQGDSAAQKSKAELKAERRAKQEAQRAAKATKKPEGGGEKPKVPPKVLQDDPSLQKKQGKKLAKQNIPVRASTGRKVALFSHLRQFDRDNDQFLHLQAFNNALDLTPSQGIHPAIVRLGLKYSNYACTGSDARAVGMLSAFDQAIADYQVPENKDFCRDLDAYISRFISFLDGCRPLSVSMGNAIKYIKWKITQLSRTPELSDAEAKDELRKGIKRFIQEKIISASEAVALYSTELICDGDVLIVYGYSSVVYKTVLKVSKEKRGIRVVVIDNRPKHEGKEMLRRLTSAGVDCMFVPYTNMGLFIRSMKNGSLVGQIQSQGRDVAHHAQGALNCKVLCGAHCVLNNAYVMSRVGTAMLAAVARALNITVLVCVELYKLCDRSQCDSFVFNELGDPDELVQVDLEEPILTADYKDNKSLSLLNLMYDVMPSDNVSSYVTEIRPIPHTAIPKVLNGRVSMYET